MRSKAAPSTRMCHRGPAPQGAAGGPESTLHAGRYCGQRVAVTGMLAGVLQWIAVARELFGLDVMHSLLLPLGLVYPLTGLWLLLRGLAPRPAAG